jgi:hypothetical protein
MTNRLAAYVPAMFQPTDPAVADPTQQDDRARTVFAAVSSAMLLVVLIAILMGMT